MGSHDEQGLRATFTTMEKSTEAEWKLIAAEYAPFAKALPERILSHLKLLEGDYGGFAVDRMTHSLQTATNAHRGGEDEEYVVCALLHDIGDTLGSFNHADVAASILKPFVSEELHWIVEKHGIFQGHNFFHHLGLDRDMREQFRGHQYFDATEEFIDKYDCPAFDPNYDTLPLEFFEPMVMKLFEKPMSSIYKRAME